MNTKYDPLRETQQRLEEEKRQQAERERQEQDRQEAARQREAEHEWRQRSLRVAEEARLAREDDERQQAQRPQGGQGDKAYRDKLAAWQRDQEREQAKKDNEINVINNEPDENRRAALLRSVRERDENLAKEAQQKQFAEEDRAREAAKKAEQEKQAERPEQAQGNNGREVRDNQRETADAGRVKTEREKYNEAIREMTRRNTNERERDGGMER